MQQDLELAIARKRDEVRASILHELEKQYGERLSERKQRLRERYDLTFSHSIDEIEHALSLELESELQDRMADEFDSYQRSRESEISTRLSRFRHDREIELRTQLGDSFEGRKQEWIDQLEQEFRSKESAVQRQIMAEIDARVRNEKISHETSLDLIKQETAMELEVEMESRLREFRGRKEQEVTDQLERQLSKREEIMRNKALIDVRRRESEIRAEIEAQLALKRAEIRERLSSLEQRSEEFKQVAEDKIRTQLQRSLVSDEDMEEEIRLKQMEEESEDLEKTDGVLARRERWMGALKGASGQVAPSAAGSLGGLTAGPKLGQPSAPDAQPSLGAPGGLAAGGRLAPTRAPIGGRLDAPAPAAAPAVSPLKSPIQQQPGTLSPVRPPIRAPEEKESAARRLADAIDMPGDPKEDESTVRKLSDAADSFPETSAGSADSMFGGAEPPSDGFGISRPRPEGVEELPQRRGPPGGGRLVREGPGESAVTRGPPGGGRLVRDGSGPEVGGPPQREDLFEVTDILQPVKRPVLQPKPEGPATLRPVGEQRKVLIPTFDEETAVLKPATATLTPIRTESDEEE
jgi:hypothetical protein